MNTPVFGLPTAAGVLAKLEEHDRKDEREFRLIRETQAEQSTELGVQTAILTRLEAVVVRGEKLDAKRAETAVEVAGERRKTLWKVLGGLLLMVLGAASHWLVS